MPNTYKEPGVYLNMQKTGALSPVGTPSRRPLLIGSGPKVLRKTITMVRASSGQVDTLPVNAAVIESIGLTQNVSSYVGTGAGSDYTFDPLGAPDKITWSAGKGPTAGQTYYVTCQYDVDDTQYERKTCYTLQDVADNYGGDIKLEDGTVNRLAVAAKLALMQGAPAIEVVQVKLAGSTPVASDYMTALDNVASFIDALWRIVPTDLSPEINAAIDGHVTKMSTVDERMERAAVYTAGATGSLNTASDVYTSIGAYAQAKANSRIQVLYPDQATAQLSDGKYYTLDGCFLAAAYAGAEATLQPQQSRTRMGIVGFSQLLGVKLKRSEMNTLAAYGVTVLTQATKGANIIVRQQLTTDMSSVQNREASIQDIADSTARYLRTSCEGYIGKYNITPDVITRISGTLNSALAKLKDDQTILDGKVLSLLQDAANPDTLIVLISVQVPYPCNYITITVALG